MDMNWDRRHVHGCKICKDLKSILTFVRHEAGWCKQVSGQQVAASFRQTPVLVGITTVRLGRYVTPL